MNGPFREVDYAFRGRDRRGLNKRNYGATITDHIRRTRLNDETRDDIMDNQSIIESGLLYPPGNIVKPGSFSGGQSDKFAPVRGAFSYSYSMVKVPIERVFWLTEN